MVESVLAAKLCRAVNNANVLALGGLILTPFVAVQAVDAWLTTAHTEGLEEHTDFLRQALALTIGSQGYDSRFASLFKLASEFTS